jgi:hypothetical protein
LIGHDQLLEMVGKDSGRLSERHTNMIDAYNKMLVRMNRED